MCNYNFFKTNINMEKQVQQRLLHIFTGCDLSEMNFYSICVGFFYLR